MKLDPVDFSNVSKSICIGNVIDTNERRAYDDEYRNDIINEMKLKCKEFGEIKDCRIQKGSIIIEFEKQVDAIQCCKELHGKRFDKRQLVLSFMNAISIEKVDDDTKLHAFLASI